MSKGISGGIEKLAKIGMPVLFIFAAILVIRVLTLGDQTVMVDGVATVTNPLQGLNFMYSPDWSKLGEPKVWLAATGQIFFTLSVGMGALQAYASYLTKKDDIALSGIATASTNEAAEVVLGGSLAIPAVVAFFGVTGRDRDRAAGRLRPRLHCDAAGLQPASGGPAIGTLAGVMWFGLLFCGRASPARWRWPRRRSRSSRRTSAGAASRRCWGSARSRFRSACCTLSTTPAGSWTSGTTGPAPSAWWWWR